MDCAQIKQIIPTYVNHTASQDQINDVEEHLCVCDSCRQHLQKVMDKDTILVPQKKAAASSDKNMGSFEYLVVGVGVVILLFFVYLLMRR